MSWLLAVEDAVYERANGMRTPPTMATRLTADPTSMTPPCAPRHRARLFSRLAPGGRRLREAAAAGARAARSRRGAGRREKLGPRGDGRLLLGRHAVVSRGLRAADRRCSGVLRQARELPRQKAQVSGDVSLRKRRCEQPAGR